ADGAEFVGALFGILQIGAVAVPINPDLRTEHLSAIVEAARPAAVIAEPVYRSRLSDAGGSLKFIEGSGRTGPIETFPTHRDDAAIWLFSGGTTGAPKIVPQTHRSFVNSTELYAKATLGYRPDDLTVAVPRLFFGYALGSAVLFPFSVGAATVLFPGPPTPEAVLDQIRRHRPTILITTPSAISGMLAASGAEDDFASLRFATSAGEALPVSLYHRWREQTGVELLDGLGTAEMWHIFITNRLGDARPGTVGRAVGGFEVKACDDHGNVVGSGEVGRLWVRGGSRAPGYWQNADLTAEAFRGEWFVGGDLVSIDHAGYVTHQGRVDDSVKVKGKWLNPAEVESCLLDHPAVRDCAVVAIAGSDGLLRPVAFVVTAGPVTEAELQQHTLDHLDPYKYPRRVFLVASLPSTHLGKVDRAALKRMAAG
ncbi:MAG: AMP-binding protein, partial [Actinomycetota bacterium]